MRSPRSWRRAWRSSACCEREAGSRSRQTCASRRRPFARRIHGAVRRRRVHARRYGAAFESTRPRDAGGRAGRRRRHERAARRGDRAGRRGREGIRRAAAQPASVCVVANDNAPGQVVISGTKAAVERARRNRQGQGHQARDGADRERAVPFAADAARRRQDARGARRGDDPSARRAARRQCHRRRSQRTRDDPPLLVEQVTGRVRWRESVLAFRALGVEHDGRSRRQQGAHRHGQAHRQGSCRR